MFRQMYEEKYIRFPQGKAKALTFSYDDGVRADLHLLEIFKKYGIKGTFNLNSKLFDCENWHHRLDEEQTFAAFADCGQEIALHGARHVFLEKTPLSEIIKEVADNRAYLEEKYGRIVRGLAYPYGSFNDDIKRVLKDLGVAYARTTISTHGFSIPKDFLEWNATCHHTEAELAGLSDKFFGASPLKEFKHREGWLFYVWGHSYEFDDNGDWYKIENLCKLANEHRGEVWLATNGEVCGYVNAYNSLIYSFDGERVYNPSAISVWVEVRGKTYEVAAGCTVSFDK